jgi:hypothetical protein
LYLGATKKADKIRNQEAEIGGAQFAVGPGKN